MLGQMEFYSDQAGLAAFFCYFPAVWYGLGLAGMPSVFFVCMNLNKYK